MDLDSAIPLAAMSYPRKQAEVVMLGLQPQINLHLAKIWAAESGQDLPHWIAELRNWLETVAEMRLKPRARTLPYAFVFGTLYDGPFGDQEESATRSRLTRLARDGIALRRTAEPETLAPMFKRFHQRFATLCADGQTSDEQLETLLASLPDERRQLIAAGH